MATCTRVVGLGGGGLESAAACCVVEVPEPTAEVPEPTAAAFESDPTVSGAAGTKKDSDSGEGLSDGLRRY